MIQVQLYQNVASVGQSNGQSNNCSISCPQSPSLSIVTAKSGVWILGSIATQSIPNTPSTTPCPSQVATESSRFVTRSKGCSTPDGTDGVETWVSDNATSLRNGITVTYQPSLVSINIPFSQVEIELIPVDLEPQNQFIDTTTLCNTTGDTCHINFANKISGINTAQNIVVGTSYCTGITTSIMTISSASNVQVFGDYAGQSRNDTGAQIMVQIYVSANAPSTSFGSGLCATGGVIISVQKIVFITSGATLTTYGINEYAEASVGVCLLGNTPCNAAGTIYAWIEITPQSVGNIISGVSNLGSTIQYAQWGAIAHSSISMIQIK